MMMAAREGHLDVVCLLANSRAAFDKRNTAGETALEIAQSHNHQDIVNFLAGLTTK